LEQESLPRDAELGDRYLISCYLVNTIFTTVGFGDVIPANQSERIFYIILMHVVSLLALLAAFLACPRLTRDARVSLPA